MSDLTAFDIYFFAAIGLLAILGFMRGFVSEILSILAWVAGIIAVNMFFDQGREKALDYVDSETTAAVLSVAVLFGGVFILGKLLAKALGGRVKNSIVGPLDRVLGFGFGAVKGLLLTTLTWMLLQLLYDVVPADRPEWFADSRSGPLLGVLSHEVQDFVEDRREMRAEEDAARNAAPEGYTDEERGALEALLELTE
ncbi:CvpA family protein [Pacificimonas sp. WHA3]|uniref:CvpA family protein n=1 Tax=Pacificimonas pallii TaxID=2827236 RepID=A0ABS6SAU4_9SPHN|nr:CvpA family protein [Pacificimonas pallii]MBV7255532.1 CvpA family protein [Pacificimonas pallii]